MSNVNHDDLPDDYNDFRPITSDDIRDRNLSRSEKEDLIEAMADDGAYLLKVKGRADTFGYYNPVSNARIEPLEFSEQHITKIMNELRADYPQQTASSIKWDMKFLFLDMPDSVLKLEEQIFDPSSNDMFPVQGNSKGQTVMKYNEFESQMRPITNTIVKPSANDELVASLMAKGIEASIESIVGHSVTKESDAARLYDEIKHTIGGFCQPVHTRLKYVPVMYGKQGSGKTLLAMLMGNLGGYMELISVDKLTGDFGARWDTACTVVSDEGQVHSEEQANMLKRFVTGTDIDLEKKYKDACSAKIQFNYIVTTNQLKEFKTFSYENRRYWVWIVSGGDMEGGDITQTFTATDEEYNALIKLREFGHVKGANSSAYALTPTDFNGADDNGNHRLKFSQMGSIIEKPTEYLGVFIALAKIVSKWGVGKRNLDTIGGRVYTVGDKMLSDGLPAQKGVEVVHDKVGAQIDLLQSGGRVKEAVTNNEYINVSKLFHGGKPTTKNDLSYLKGDFWHNGNAYTTIIGGEWSNTLLIKCHKNILELPEGQAIKKAALAKINELESDIDGDDYVPAKELSPVDAVTKCMEQAEFDANGGMASITVAEMSKLTGVSKYKLSRMKKSLPEHIGFSKDIFTIG